MKFTFAKFFLRLFFFTLAEFLLKLGCNRYSQLRSRHFNFSLPLLMIEEGGWLEARGVTQSSHARLSTPALNHR